MVVVVNDIKILLVVLLCLFPLRSLFVAVTFSTKSIRYHFDPFCDLIQHAVPHCDTYGKPANLSNNLLYFELLDDNGAVNASSRWHVFVSSIGFPTVLMVETALDSNIRIMWEDILTDRGSRCLADTEVHQPCLQIENIKADAEVFGMMFSKLILFNDDNDQYDISKANPNQTISYLLDNLNWLAPTQVGQNEYAIELAAGHGELNEKLMGNGSLTLKISLFANNGVGPRSPHLVHTDTAVQLDLIFDNLNVDDFSSPRFAIETVLVSSKQQSNSTSNQQQFHIDAQDSINDADTPGIFTSYIASVLPDQGFLLWKPVSYTTKASDFTYSTHASHGCLTEPSSQSSTRLSLLQAFFGDSLHNHSVAMNTTFGYARDKFYSSTSFLSWTVVVGHGRVPSNQITAEIIVMAVICVALPLLLIIFGVMFWMYQKRKNSNSIDAEPLVSEE